MGDSGLRRELHRLNLDYPEMKFFQLRDRAIKWWSISSKTRSQKLVSNQETRATLQPDSSSVIKRQDIINRQQEQIEKLMETVKSQANGRYRRNTRDTDGERRCWASGSLDHLRMNCPKYRHQQSEKKAQDLN